MRIRSYLTIVILVCLFGTYIIEFALGNQRHALQSLTQRHHVNQYAVRDFQHIRQNISQLLVSADLILASGETYLLSGAVEQALLLLEQVEGISASASEPGGNPLLESIEQTVGDIHKILIETRDVDFVDRASSSIVLLERYDDTSLILVKNLEIIFEDISRDLETEAAELERVTVQTNQMQIISIIAFSILVFLLWYWANRQISKPLQTLSRMAVDVKQTGRFAGIAHGPEEMLMLSNELSILTNSLLHQANHDPLTKLNNRREFERQLTQTMEKSERRNENTANTLCYIDLDRFKIVNDTCGHSAGDELLTGVADALMSSARQNDVVARVGGDEFTLLLRDCNIESAKVLAERMLEKIEGIRYISEDNEFRISASIGLTAISGKEINLQEIVNAADAACRMAKEAGRGQVQILDIEDERVDNNRQELLHLNLILNAIDESRFVLYFHDIVSLQGHEEFGRRYEILIRMNAENGETLYPEEFLPIIERYHMSSHLDKWVVGETASLLIHNPEELENLDLCSINLSARSLSDESFRLFVLNLLEENPELGPKLCFEIAETAVIDDVGVTTRFINELKKYHVRFAIDDFGAGHSSFDYLQDLPVDYVKINGVIVKEMLNNSCDMATVKSIVELGRTTGKIVIAENVHSQAIAEYFTEKGVAYAQGNYFSEPSLLSFDATYEKEKELWAEQSAAVG